MAPNLSFEHIALVLALAGCSKATPAADTSSTVRSDPSASAQPVVTQGSPPPPTVTATVIATTSPAPGGGAASATELRKKMDMHPSGSTGQASCGAGSCTSEIKKK